MKMDMHRRLCLAPFVLLLLIAPVTFSFYIPGFLPVDYKNGDPVDLWVNKVYSDKTQLPYEYMTLPVCHERDETVIRENLGEVLRGDRFVKSGYQIEFGKDVSCAVLCTVTVSESDAKWVSSLISNEYKVEWYLDNLPGATPYRTTGQGRKLYEPGFKLGYIDDAKKTYLHNHVNIAILFNKETEDSLTSRIVGFEIYPKSISSSNRNNECPKEILEDLPPQEINGQSVSVVYSYSIEFREEKEVAWGARWDRFLVNSDPNIHWYSIVNSLIILIFLSAMVAVIMLRTLHNDISLYNEEDNKEDQEEVTGWKLVHGDVFRSPKYGWLLAICVGSGVQLLGAVLTTVVLAMVGVLNPSYRGGMMSFAGFLYVFMGAFAGYYSARMYKVFKGSNWQKNAMMTATLFPGIIFAVYFLLNFFIWSQRSSSAIPFGTFAAMFAMWFGLSAPLVFIGAYFGQKKKTIEHPVRTNQIPRQIPEVSWFLRAPASIAIGGLLPFAVVFIELFFIMKSVWQDQYYYMYGFLTLVFLILVITCVEITIVIIYFTLCSEDYNWWWRSFFVSSSSSLYIFFYAIFYYISRLDISQFIPALIYFVNIFSGCVIFALCTGTIGFFSCYYFVIKIYGAVKVD